GIGVEVPGLDDIRGCFDAPGARVAARFDPTAKLGAKRLAFKDRATRLALCAAQAALADADLPVTAARARGGDAAGVAVSSNLGNLEPVCRVASEIHRRGVDGTSVLDLPNASSNVIASTIAIRFGCRAINLMICSGATSGLEAIRLAALAIGAGRAARMVVVGVEPANEFTDRMMRDSARAWLGDDTTVPRCGDAAGAIVLEAPASAADRGARVRALVGRYA